MTEDRPEDIADQQRLLAAHRRTLASYLEQLATFDKAFAPPHVKSGIQEARDDIRRIKEVLRGWNVHVEDHPNDELSTVRHPTRSGTVGTHSLTPRPQPSLSKLCDKISTPPTPLGQEPPRDGYWPVLERAAMQAAVAGGVAAMSYYREALPWPTDLMEQDQGAKNPSTVADLEATAAILQTIDPFLKRIDGKLGCSRIYLGEETEYRSWLEKNLSEGIPNRIHSPDSFFSGRENILRVIIDGIDGTGNFVRGIPLFCSAVAILVEDQARVSAIYDPIHHIVYSAVLKGSYENPVVQRTASIWQVAAGNRADLTQVVKKEEAAELKKEPIGVHLTRSYPGKLREFLESQLSLGELCRFLDSSPSSEELRAFLSDSRLPEELRKFLKSSPSSEKLRRFLEHRLSPTGSMLERLAGASGGIYALGSGIVAMTDVARGALGGFVNNYTNLWDIAAGEVLVLACGGEVTDFTGARIDYSSAGKSSVVAAKEPLLHSAILEILRESREVEGNS